MKKVLVFTVASLVAGSSLAAVGWYDDFLSVSVNEGADTQYSLVGGGTAWHGADLGVVSTLTLEAIDCKYWASDPDDRTGGALSYQVFEDGNGTAVAGPTEVIWSHASIGGNDYQGIWSGSQDMLDGYSLVADTTYYVQVWAKSWGTSGGDNYLNNGGASTNYEATFTAAVPEPAVMGFVTVAGIGALFIRRIFMM